MKSYHLILVACLGLCASQADGQKRTMVINPGTSETKKIELSTQTRITFSNNFQEMIVSQVDSDSIYAINVDNIENIVFTIESTSNLSDLQFDDLLISYNDGQLSISGSDQISYSIWNLSAIKILEGEGMREVTLDLSDLVKGVYVIKANNKSLKFIKH